MSNNAFQGNAFQNTSFQALPSANSSVHAYLLGPAFLDVGTSNSAYLSGSFHAPNPVHAYLCGGVNSNSSVGSYSHGITTANSSNSCYTSGWNLVEVGPGAINRTGTMGDYGTRYTFLDLTTPANHSGTLTSVSIYVYDPIFSYAPLVDTYIGVFYLVDGTTYRCRSAVSLGDVPEGLQTISGLELSVQQGDLIGISFTAGKIERDSGKSTSLTYAGNACVENAENTFTVSSHIMSIYASGYEYFNINNEIQVYLFGCYVGQNSTSAYMLGFGTEAISSIPAFLQSANIDTNASLSAYLSGSFHAPNPVHAYLRGGIRDFVNSYLTGVLGNLSTTAPSYLYGVLFTNNSAYVYLTGTTGKSGFVRAYIIANAITDTSAPVFLNGNMLSYSSQTAYVTSLIETINCSTNAYAEGIIKSILSCYLTGQMTSVDYIQLKTSDNGLTKSKKFKILADSYEEATKTKNENIIKTISGGIDHAIGENSTTWRMVLKIRAGEADPDYGNLSDLEYFYSLNNPNSSPSNDIIFVDHHKYEYIVHMIGTFKKSLISVSVEGQQALYFCSLEVLKIL